MAADARSSRSKSNVRCHPTTTASAGPASTTSKPLAWSASTTPGPLQARTFEPGARSAASRSAAARALVSTSDGSASTPIRASFSTYPATGRLELLVMNPTASPAARNRATAPAAPGSAPPPSHSTPSRSSTTAGAASETVTASDRRRLAESVLVGLVVGPHDRGDLQVPQGSGPVTGPEQAQPEPEVGVVVHRVELEDLLELHPGRLHPLRPVIGPGQGLPDRSLVRLEVAGPFQGHDGRVAVTGIKQSAALLEAVVGLAGPTREALGTCARTGALTRSGSHGARTLPLSRSPLRSRRARRRPRRRDRPALRRHRRGEPGAPGGFPPTERRPAHSPTRRRAG